MHKIRALIVDDEPPARKRLRELLALESDVEMAGECSGGVEAVTKIQELAPELIFLDIQMPAMDGFAVLEKIEPQRRPFTIFVTAYDAYAIQAFEVHALDYLLKPFSDERFEMALARAKQVILAQKTSQFQTEIVHLLEDYRGLATTSEPRMAKQVPSERVDRLVVKSRQKVIFLKTAEIDWIEAAGVYVNLHSRGQSHLYRETIGRLEFQLDPGLFVRIHRSTMVNIERIQELRPYSHGEYVVLLHDGTKLKLSRSYRTKLQARLGKSF